MQETAHRRNETELDSLIDWTRVPGAEAAASSEERRSRLCEHIRQRNKPFYIFDLRDRDEGVKRLKSRWPDSEKKWLDQAQKLLDDPAAWKTYGWRHGFLDVWRWAYILTRDDRYVAQALVQLASWLDGTPAFRDPFPNRDGRMGLEWGCGGLTMLDLLGATRDSAAWTDERLTWFLALLWEHFEKTTHQRPYLWHNMFTIVNGFRHAFAVCLPEFKTSDAWARESLEIVEEGTRHHTRADGSNREQSPNYHWAVFHAMTVLAQARQVNGLPVPAAILDTIDRNARFMHAMRTPANDMPVFSDTGEGYSLPSILFSAAVCRTDHRYFDATPSAEQCLALPAAAVAATLARPTLPRGPKDTMCPDAGYYFMRSGPEAGATYLAFDAGPNGYYHGHQDLLNVILMRGKRTLLFDPGYPRAKTSYLRGTPYHSTISLDGLSHRPYEDEFEALADVSQWDPRPDGAVLLSARHRAYDHLWGRPVVRRQIYFDGDRDIVIVDRIDCAAMDVSRRPHAFITSFNLTDGDRTELNEREGWCRTTFPEGPNLAIRCLNAADVFSIALGEAEACVASVKNPKQLKFCINADRTWMAFGLRIADGDVRPMAGTASGDARGPIRVEFEGSHGPRILIFEPDAMKV